MSTDLSDLLAITKRAQDEPEKAVKLNKENSMRELLVGISYEDQSFCVGYITEEGLTDDHVRIPFTEVTPALSELLSFLEPALQAEAEQESNRAERRSPDAR